MIRKLVKDARGNIQLTLDLTLDPKAFNNLNHAREFIIKNQTKIEKMIAKFAVMKSSIPLIEVTNKQDRAVVKALQRLGVL